jgi:hypothetical protein
MGEYSIENVNEVDGVDINQLKNDQLKKYKFLIGDGTSREYRISNPFSSDKLSTIMIQVIQASGDYKNVYTDISRDTTNDEIVINFEEPATNDGYNVITIA